MFGKAIEENRSEEGKTALLEQLRREEEASLQEMLSDEGTVTPERRESLKKLRNSVYDGMRSGDIAFEELPDLAEQFRGEGQGPEADLVEEIYTKPRGDKTAVAADQTGDATGMTPEIALSNPVTKNISKNPQLIQQEYVNSDKISDKKEPEFVVTPPEGGQAETILGRVKHGENVSSEELRPYEKMAWAQALMNEREGNDSVRGKILSLSESATTNQGKKNERVSWGFVRKDEAERLSKATGIDIPEGTVHVIDESDIWHAHKQHGGKGEVNRGQIPLTKEDYALIPNVVANPDVVENAGKTAEGLTLFRYSKRVNGHVVVVEEYRNKRNQLAFKTMWKRPATTNALSQGKVPGLTSEATAGMNSNIDIYASNVKGNPEPTNTAELPEEPEQYSTLPVRPADAGVTLDDVKAIHPKAAVKQESTGRFILDFPNGESLRIHNVQHVSPDEAAFEVSTARGVVQEFESGKMTERKPGSGERQSVEMEELLRKSPVAVTTISGNEIPDQKTFHDLRNEAKNYARDNLRGVYRNNDTGWDISVAQAGIKETAARARTENDLKSIAAIPGMLKNAVKISTSSHDPKNDDIKWVHHFVAPVQIGDNLFLSSIVVKETTQGEKYYYHDLTEMEKPSGVTAEWKNKSTTAAPADGFSNRISIDHIIAFVKKKHLPAETKEQYSADENRQDATPIPEETQKEVSDSILNDVFDVVGAVKDWGKKLPGKPDLSGIAERAGLPALWSRRGNEVDIPALRRLAKAGMSIPDKKYAYEVQIFGTEDAPIGYGDLVSLLRKLPKEYARLRDYLVKRDRNRWGHTVRMNNGKWTLVSPDGADIETFDTEKEAWGAAITNEADNLRRIGYSEDAARALVGFRRIGHNMYDMLARSAKELDEEARNAGQEPPTVKYKDDDGNEHEITLRDAVAQMGDLRGSYFPRTRQSGNFAIVARKGLFQSTRPRRARHMAGGFNEAGTSFQSTRPRRARPPSLLLAVLLLLCFNPRAREGRDRRRTQERR